MKHFDGSYPCKNCPRSKDCVDLDCSPWRKWFAQEWQNIRKAADKVRARESRYEILREKRKLYKENDDSPNYKV